MSGKNVKADLKGKGYDPAIADEIAMKVANKNVPKNVPVKPTDIDDAIANIPKPPVKSRSTWTALKQWGIGASLSIGAIALLYYYFNDGDVEDVVDTEETTPSPQPAPQPRTSQYSACTEDMPIRYGCKNETIKKVQTCLNLGVSGNFDEFLKSELARYKSTYAFREGFSDSDVQKICIFKQEEDRQEALKREQLAKQAQKAAEIQAFERKYPQVFTPATERDEF
jgi:predicted GIY-YIG superfamily endonuclease